MCGKKYFLAAVVFILLANQPSAAAGPNRRSGSLQQNNPSIRARRMQSREFSPERLLQTALYRRMFAIRNGESPKKTPCDYLTRKEKQGLRRLIESQMLIKPDKSSLATLKGKPPENIDLILLAGTDLEKFDDQNRYKQYKALLGRRYARAWLKKRDAQRHRLKKKIAELDIAKGF